MKTISFHTTKGGTGKSTLSIITINSLISAGYKCLAIDTDTANHSLSFYYNSGIPFETIQDNNIFKVFAGSGIQENIIPIHDLLDLVHADVRLSDFRSIDNFKRLKRQIHELTDYDYVVIDTAPSYDNIIINVLYASDTLIIPVIPDVFNFQALKFLFEKLSDLDLANLEINVVFNQYDKPRTENLSTFTNQVVNLFRHDAGISPFITAQLTRSTPIKKYVNDDGYRINDRQETVRQYAEIKNYMAETLAVNLNGRGI